MRRAKFTRAVAWWLTLAILYALLLWNVALASAVGHLTGLIHSFLLAGLLYMVYTGHALTRIALQLWAFFALVFPSGFKAVSKLLLAMGQEEETVRLPDMAGNLALLGVGLVLLFISWRFVRITVESPRDPGSLE